MSAEPGDQKRENASQAYRLLAEEASDIVVVYEPDGRVYFASPALQRVLKRNGSDFDRKTFLDIVHPEDVALAKIVTATPLACLT